MDAATLKALKAGIAKYDGALKGEKVRFGSAGCSLCRLFIGSNCKGCPVRESTGKPGCVDTPYHDMVSTFGGIGTYQRVSTAEQRLAVKAMRDFLKGLLPKMEAATDSVSSVISRTDKVRLVSRARAAVEIDAASAPQVITALQELLERTRIVIYEVCRACGSPHYRKVVNGITVECLNQNGTIETGLNYAATNTIGTWKPVSERQYIEARAKWRT